MTDLNLKKNNLLFIKLFVTIITANLLSGYGYSGNLPDLGEKIKKPFLQETVNKKSVPDTADDSPQFPATKMFFPRIYSNYNINKYSDYLSDIKQVEPVLISLKQTIRFDRKNKVQHFCAKVNVLNLYIKDLQYKYGDGHEKNYESFKQLVILDKYLTEAADYQRETDKYRKTLRGSLANKLEDETYMRKKTDMSINSINAVLDIIQNAD